jgi:hypothetical protein
MKTVSLCIESLSACARRQHARPMCNALPVEAEKAHQQGYNSLDAQQSPARVRGHMRQLRAFNIYENSDVFLAVRPCKRIGVNCSKRFL